MSAAITALLPRWTKRVTIEEGGRDPLGLSRVSSMITDFLLQGIITQTYRARYYSFYCWAIWHIETEEQPDSYEQFANAFQRRDTLFTLASLEANSDASPVGIKVAAPRHSAAKKSGEVFCNFRVLPSNALGAYGQYYTGSIYELGLTSRDDKGIHHVSDTGESLALAFHATIEDTPYIKKKQFLDSSLRWNDFVKTAARFNLDYLPSSILERDLLTKLFLSDGLKSDRALMRRSSLTLLMWVVNAYNEAGWPILNRDIWELVYAPFYYGQLNSPKGKSRRLDLPPAQVTTVEFWRCFCLHQLLTQVLENLLSAVLEIVSGTQAGLTIEEICSQLTSAPFLEQLEQIQNASCERPRDLLINLGLLSSSLSPAVCRQNQSRLDLDHPSSESRILDRSPSNAYEMTAIAVSLLAVLYSKWGGLTTAVTRYISQNAGPELHADLVFPYLISWFEERTTWSEALMPILSNLVLEQHDKVMYEKGKLESCWLHRTEGRVVKDQDYSPSYRSPRTDNSVSILSDLGLLQVNSDKEISVTNRGNTQLRRLMT